MAPLAPIIAGSIQVREDREPGAHATNALNVPALYANINLSVCVHGCAMFDRWEWIGIGLVAWLIVYGLFFAPPSLEGKPCGPDRVWTYVTVDIAGTDLSCE